MKANEFTPCPTHTGHASLNNWTGYCILCHRNNAEDIVRGIEGAMDFGEVRNAS